MKKALASMALATLIGMGATAQTSSTTSSGKRTTPMMGWASWNQFGASINEDLIKAQADAMASSGLLAAGYQYLNIDDGFFNGRNPDGSLRTDSIKFPHGLKYLADYIHSKGLKAGFYSEAGQNTCGSMYSGQPGGKGGGLYGHDQQDIDLVFLKWGFDFIKVDYCGGREQKLDERTRYTQIRQAIDNTGRKDINYNVCRWQFPGTWITQIADSWRMSNDINFTPGSKAKWSSIMGIINQNKYLAPYASPGHYNDMDMLEVGRGLSAIEDRSHFSMWCILSSPLAMGQDMAKMSEETKSILTQPEVIAINQDPAGLQAELLDESNGIQTWAKHLTDRQSNVYAVALLNTSDKETTASIDFKQLDVVGEAQVRDVWKRSDLGTMKSYQTTLPAHGIALLKVTADKTKLREQFEAEYAWINNFNLTINTSILGDQGKPVAAPNCSGTVRTTTSNSVTCSPKKRANTPSPSPIAAKTVAT